MRALLAIVLFVTLFSQRAEAVRLVCFGDSVTEGYGVAQADAWCNRLGGINAGVGGNTTETGLQRFRRDVLARRPRVVTIMFGLGDSYHDSRRVPLPQYRRNLVQMIRELKERDVRVILMTSNPTMRTWANLTLRDYVRVVREVARREDVELVDLFQEFAETLTTGVRYNELLMDEVHPSTYGHAIIFEMVRAKL